MLLDAPKPILGELKQTWLYFFKMEEEVTKAITTTVLKEYGNPDHPKVTKAIDFAQEKVNNYGI